MHWRPTFWEDMTPEEIEVLGPHGEYVGTLFDAGRVVVAGGIMEPPGGIVCFEADGRDEARAVMEADPLFPARIVEITLHELRAGFIGGRYDFRQGGPPRDPN
jgi:hypothetical protein